MTTAIKEVSSAQNSPVVAAIEQVLADTYAVYAKTHSYHWNVTGPSFHQLHTMFEEHYTEMWQAIDVMAERLRALGAYAPMNFSSMAKKATIGEDDTIPNAQTMLKNLTSAHAALIAQLNKALSTAQKAEDEVSVDLILGRLSVHEKTLWMLKSSQGE